MMTSRNGRTLAGPPRTNDLQEAAPPDRRRMPPEGGVSDAAMPPGAVSTMPPGAVSNAPPPVRMPPERAPQPFPMPGPMPVDRMPMGGAPQPFPMPGPMPPIGGSGGSISAMPPGVGGVGGPMPPTLSPAMQGLEGLIAGAGPGNVQPPGRQPQQRASSRELAKLSATKPGRRVY
jgi:hypothetical protein